MTISRNNTESILSFAAANSIEIQAVRVLLRLGILDARHETIGKKKYVFIKEDQRLRLVEGVNFVTCAHCGKKMLSISAKHTMKCTGLSYSEFLRMYPAQVKACHVASERKKFTEERKGKISSILKERFKTPAGEATRKAIGEASKKLNQLDSVRERKRLTMLKRYEDPKELEKSSLQSIAMWRSKEHREKISKYLESNKEHIQKSAAHARLSLEKTSKLHLGFKKALPERISSLLTTELQVGFYSLDEGNQQHRICIEIDGCYWHGCHECGFPPQSRIAKIDKGKTSYLTSRGWRILRVKECDIRNSLAKCIKEVTDFVEGVVCSVKK